MRPGGDREAIERGIQNKERTIRVPVHVIERERKIAKAERRLGEKLEREPTDEEVNRRPKPVGADDRRGAIRGAHRDQPRQAGRRTGRLSLGDVLPGEDGDPLDQLDLSLRRETLRRAVDCPTRSAT